MRGSRRLAERLRVAEQRASPMARSMWITPQAYRASRSAHGTGGTSPAIVRTPSVARGAAPSRLYRQLTASRPSSARIAGRSPRPRQGTGTARRRARRTGRAAGRCRSARRGALDRSCQHGSTARETAVSWSSGRWLRSPQLARSRFASTAHGGSRGSGTSLRAEPEPAEPVSMKPALRQASPETLRQREPPGLAGAPAPVTSPRPPEAPRAAAAGLSARVAEEPPMPRARTAELGRGGRPRAALSPRPRVAGASPPPTRWTAGMAAPPPVERRAAAPCR